MITAFGTANLSTNFPTRELSVNTLFKEMFPYEQYTVLFDRFQNNEDWVEAKSRFFILVKKAQFIRVTADYKIYDSSAPLYPDHEPVNYCLEYSDSGNVQPVPKFWSGEVIKIELDFKLNDLTYRMVDAQTKKEYFELFVKTTGRIQQLGNTEIEFYL